MDRSSTPERAPILFLPHGGGPLPILGEPGHAALVDFLGGIGERLGTPDAILVVSAHWEQGEATLTGGSRPDLVYDYQGFPPESYAIAYPARGLPSLAARARELLVAAGIAASVDARRGFDHGVFIPLKLVYPDAQVPVVQLSLVESLDPGAHLRLGKAIAPLREDNVLIVGSGLSFHNLRSFFSPGAQDDARCEAFDAWLGEVCCGDGLSREQREQRLAQWERAPHARFCHPREEHLLPLHVCLGAASDGAQRAERVFNDALMGKRVSAFLWS